MITTLLVIFVILIAAIGASIGSFSNVVIWRVPEKMSLTSPPSHCPKCNSPVRWFDNIPIFSWFILRGKCRNCKQQISGRYPLVEFLGCFVATVLGTSILLGNWTGFKFQPLYWTEYASWTTQWNVKTNVEITNSSEERLHFSAEKISQEENDMEFSILFLQERFLDLLKTATFLSIFWTVIIVFTLILGFVEYDRGDVPSSLIWTTGIIVLLGCLVSWLLRDSSFVRWSIVCITSIGSGALGCIPLLYWIPRERVKDCIALGSLWGFSTGYIYAFPGFLLIMLVSLLLCRKKETNYTGLIVFATLLCFIICESLVFMSR